MGRVHSGPLTPPKKIESCDSIDTNTPEGRLLLAAMRNIAKRESDSLQEVFQRLVNSADENDKAVRLSQEVMREVEQERKSFSEQYVRAAATILLQNDINQSDIDEAIRRSRRIYDDEIQAWQNVLANKFDLTLEQADSLILKRLSWEKAEAIMKGCENMANGWKDDPAGLKRMSESGMRNVLGDVMQGSVRTAAAEGKIEQPPSKRRYHIINPQGKVIKNIEAGGMWYDKDNAVTILYESECERSKVIATVPKTFLVSRFAD